MADAKLTALSELSVPSLDDLAYIVDDPAGTPASYKVAQNRLGGMYSPATCQGRLTTESGVPISTSDRTAQSTIYFTPYLGDRVALYDGTRWKLYAFTERSLALSSLTAAKPYDVCLYDNAGTLTLELTAWTSATARATALVAQDGVWVKTGATTRRYVGTIYTTGTTTTEDSAAKRFVWNAQQAVPRPLLRIETAVSWTYSTATYRQANANAANQVEVVVGLVGSMLNLGLTWTVQTTAVSAGPGGIGEDSTTTPMASCVGRYSFFGSANEYGIGSVSVAAPVPLGYHAYTWLEAADGGQSVVFLGTRSSSPVFFASGLSGTVLA